MSYVEITPKNPRTFPLNCCKCGKEIKVKPDGFDPEKPFIEGNFIHDVPFRGAEWKDLNPRHARCKPPKSKRK